MTSKDEALLDLSQSVISGVLAYVFRYADGSWSWASADSPVGQNCARGFAEDFHGTPIFDIEQVTVQPSPEEEKIVQMLAGFILPKP